MAEYEKIVRILLKENDCYFVRREKGDHDIWHSPLNNNRNFPVDTVIKSRHIANTIMKQSGIKHRF